MSYLNCKIMYFPSSITKISIKEAPTETKKVTIEVLIQVFNVLPVRLAHCLLFLSESDGN